jgi:hypothetical protein
VDRHEEPTGDTFDYGLAPGETFEPDDLGEIDRAQPHIMTVLGPVEPGALGVANVFATFATTPDDPALILGEIEEAGFAGINALLNLAPLANAEEAERARWLASRCDLHLLVATTPRTGEEDAASRLLNESEHGIDGAGVFPAAIVTSMETSSLLAADLARAVTGLPLIIRADEAGDAFPILRLLESATIDASGVTVVVDAGVGAARQLLEAKVNLLVELERGNAALNQAGVIAQLVQDGFAEQLLPGFNPRAGTDALSYGEGSRWSWLIEQFPLLLLDAGLDAMTVRTLLIENPNRILTIRPPALPGSPEESS